MSRATWITLWLAIVIAGCRTREAPRSDDAPSVVKTMGELRSEVERRESILRSEVAKLGASDPWAGVYELDQRLGSTTVIVCPSGCLAMQFGCLGLVDATWGSVERVGDRIHLRFEPPKESVFFCTDYLLVGTGVNKSLMAVVPPEESNGEVREFKLAGLHSNSGLSWWSAHED